MKSKFLAFGLMLLGTASLALAQTAASSTPSLADLARQQRAERMKVMQEHSVRIWNNDNIPRHQAGQGPTAAAAMSPVPVAPEAPSSLETSTPSVSGEHDEKYFRDQKNKLTERLELHKRQLAVLQQKQAQGQLQYYPDPNKTLQEEFSRSEINKKNAEVAEKEKEIAEDEKALQDLQEMLRREGRPAGWLR
jgi:hypothetical protein